MTDELDALVDAYRTEVDRPPHDAAPTRRAILRAARLRRQRRTLAIAASVALALVLTNATTFAWSTGRIDGVRETMLSWAAGDTPSPTTAPAAQPRRPIATTSEPTVAVEGPVTPARDDRAPEAALAPPAPVARRRSGARAGSGREPSAAPATAQAAPDDALEAEFDTLTPPPAAERLAFERAHRAQFEARDYLGALSAWTTYLRAYPTGRLLPEARFNRAVCLLRLQRFQQAEEALARIARSESLRRSDAADLLRALEEGRIRPTP
ncbi:MAG: tol-pal system YbgF family protein [Sandaracinaceae bacterium]